MFVQVEDSSGGLIACSIGDTPMKLTLHESLLARAVLRGSDQREGCGAAQRETPRCPFCGLEQEPRRRFRGFGRLKHQPPELTACSPASSGQLWVCDKGMYP